MPVVKCSNGKYRIGSGECIYDTEEKALQTWKAILASGLYGKPSINGKANNSKQDNVRKEEGRKTEQE